MSATPLPAFLRPFFWDHDFDALRWPDDRALVIERLLTRGTLATWQWVREVVGDEGLRSELARTRGKTLTARQLRFWQVVLFLPEAEVTAWIRAKEGSTWFGRTAREAPPRGA